MKHGLGYIYFLILVMIMLSVILSLSNVLITQNNIKKHDLAGLRAKYYALSALEYFKNNLELTNHQETELTQQKLFSLSGQIQNMDHGGFKIVKNKDRVYFIGYCGENINNAAGYKIISKTEGNLEFWSE